MAKEGSLLLKGGHVIDPANSIDTVMDVSLRDGLIAKVGKNLNAAGADVIDLTGYFITPGLIDMHTHVYLFDKGPDNYVGGIHADAHLFASGVTTTVDAGTAGWRNFDDFEKRCIAPSRVRILAFVNIAGPGMVEASKEQDITEMRPREAAAVATTFPDVVVGIKTAHYRVSGEWDESHPPWESVDRAIEAAELCGRPVMVDFFPRPPERSYPDLLLRHLRPGDIHTHMFARQFPIVDSHDKVNRFMREAREKGIIFDLGHGAGSFLFRNAVPALRDGFPPDSISTDLHMDNINGPVVSMARTISKLLNIGMPLQEAIMRSTVAPAREIGHPELGTLTPGAEADVAVFSLADGAFGFADTGKAKLTGSRLFDCAMTIRKGKMVYDPAGLSMPEWENAPAEYWEMPG
jgi:dihydroorotase